MQNSREKQIEKLKLKIKKAEICKGMANTRQQQDSDQRRIDALNVQLKELQS